MNVVILEYHIGVTSEQAWWCPLSYILLHVWDLGCVLRWGKGSVCYSTETMQAQKQHTSAFTEDSVRKVQFQNNLYSVWRPSTILKATEKQDTAPSIPESQQHFFKGGSFVNIAFWRQLTTDPFSLCLPKQKKTPIKNKGIFLNVLKTLYRTEFNLYRGKELRIKIAASWAAVAVSQDKWQCHVF